MSPAPLAFSAALPLQQRPRPAGGPARRSRGARMCSRGSSSRRAFLLSAGAALLAPGGVGADVLPPRSGEMHAELSELASKMPGAGMPDVYYPAFFAGEWLVTRELYAVETPAPALAPAHATLGAAAIAAARERIGRRQSYAVRFVRHRGRVIEERLGNERAEAASLFPRQRVGATWDRDNPNVLTVSRAPGGAAHAVTREVRVTKRAFVDGPQGYGTFVASEYARVVDVEEEGSLAGFGRPPSIYGRRRIARYRVSSVNNDLEPDGMDRIVVEYIYPPSPPSAKPAVVYKYRDFLNRTQERRGGA